ncbi:MAG: hypothetical protein IPI34_12720 [bacterium]|nr:hypothetical protein [bacterium]
MKLLAIISIVLSLMIPSTAGLAAIDPLPEGIGVYFDTEASALCQAPGGDVTCYLMLTNASGPFVLAWTCAVEIDTNLPASAFEEWWIRIGLNIVDTEDPVTMVSQFIVGTEWMPSPTNGYFILASRRISTINPDDFVSFRVFPLLDPEYPACTLCYVGMLGYETPLHVVNGNTDVPQTFITSGDCVVANEAITWGQLKALY